MMDTWLVVLLLVVSFVVGMHCGVNVIGGWRDLRRDLLKIRQEDLRVRQLIRDLSDDGGTDA